MTTLDHHLDAVFAAQAQQPAVRCGAQHLTYAELDGRARSIARQMQAYGLTAGDRVGLHLPRSPDLIAAVLACLRSGLCFVPLEPEFPSERLATIARDARLALILQGDPAAPELGCRAHRLRPGQVAEAAWPALDAEQPAYMMFTSGSTGQPKGVVISRRALAHFLGAATARLGLDATTHWLFVTTPAFDISLLEMLGPLWVGGQVEVIEAPLNKDPVGLARYFDECPSANTLQATPAFWRMLLKAGWAGHPGLRALCGGEALDVALADVLCERVSVLWNCYGPTEATVWSLMGPVNPGAPGIVLRGTLDGYSHRLLDGEGRPTPPGEVGELCIGGPALANGYWERPDLTEAAFVEWRGQRLYRTGDRARALGEDCYQYLGRVDDQVKLRGFRIELGEVEAALRRLDGVQDAAVRLHGTGEEACLVGYVEPSARGAVGKVALRRALLRQLPAYMVPARIVLLDSLPKTGSGKIDRKRLALPA